jgi:hypothetical protein
VVNTGRRLRLCLGVVDIGERVAEFAWGCATNARRVPRNPRSIRTNMQSIV